MAKATWRPPDGGLISSEDVHGTNVYGIGDEAIGEIDHLLIEKVSGRVAYAVMSFGGFLGLAHSHYPIPWSALKYDIALQGYRTGITEAQLKTPPPSATILGLIETGRPELISTTAHPRTGVHESNSDERTCNGDRWNNNEALPKGSFGGARARVWRRRSGQQLLAVVV